MKTFAGHWIYSVSNQHKTTERRVYSCMSFIHTNINGFVYAGFTIDVNVTDTLTVAQHRNALSRPLNVSDQLRRTPRNDQVDNFVQLAQILDFFTCAHLHSVVNVSVSRTFWRRLKKQQVLPAEWHRLLHELRGPPE